VSGNAGVAENDRRRDGATFCRPFPAPIFQAATGSALFPICRPIIRRPVAV